MKWLFTLLTLLTGTCAYFWGYYHAIAKTCVALTEYFMKKGVW